MVCLFVTVDCLDVEDYTTSWIKGQPSRAKILVNPKRVIYES